jgi:hypothetical protein
MNEKQFKDIMAKLDQISKLLGVTIVKDFKNQKAQIIALSQYGFKPMEICSLLGAKRGYVDNTLSTYRKEHGKK